MMSRLSMNVSSSLCPYPALDPIFDDQTHTKSASQAQAEREIKALKEENKKLKQEIAEIGSAYKQLITENTHENYDERRVNFLKAQMIQLERQILILSESLSSRSSTLLDVENALGAIADLCRQYLSQMSRIGDVSMTTDDVNRLVETAESARIKLYKNIENTSVEKVKRPVAMFDKFLRPSTHHPVSLMDVCTGDLQHINLKHVAKLESRLSLLYKQLMLLNQSLHSIVKPNEVQDNQEKALFESANEEKDTFKSAKPANRELPKCLFARLGTQVTKACNMLKDITQELLMLSILVPSAPWPLLKKPLVKEMTTENVMSKFTGMSRSKLAEVRIIVENLLKAMNYSAHMATVEAKVLKEEVIFHQEVYQHQLEYTESLWQAFRVGYSDFQTNTNNLICQPMQEILDVYETLQLTASEVALKQFLKLFKQNHIKMTEAVHKLSVHLEQQQGVEAISAYEEDFFNTMNKLRVEQQEKRDVLLGDLELAKQQFLDYGEEIHKMFPDQAAPKASSICSVEQNEVDRLETNQLEKEAMLKNVLEQSDQKEKQKLEMEKSKRSMSRKVDKKAHKDEITHKDERNAGTDIPECNCGAEHSGIADPENPPQVESLYNVDESCRAKHRVAKERDINNAKSTTGSRRPPRLMKGVAQSKLILNPKTTSKRKNSIPSQTTQDIESPRQDLQPIKSDWRAGSLSDISQSSFDSCQDHREAPAMVRSGSLSRLGLTSHKPSHLEPLVSPLAYSRFNKGSSSTSHQWK